MRRLSLVVVGAVAMAAGLYFQIQRTAPLERPEIGGYVLDTPRGLPELSLVDANGNAVSEKDFLGDWSFVYFGYTYCPDVCPLSLVELSRVKRAFADALPSISDRYYLVSVDPQRDTPERLHEYVTYFDPEFRGLSGDDDDLAKFALAAAVVYEVPESPADQNYLVGHTSSVTVIDPQGRVYAIFTQPHTAAQITADFPHILEYYNQQQ